MDFADSVKQRGEREIAARYGNLAGEYLRAVEAIDAQIDPLAEREAS